MIGWYNIAGVKAMGINEVWATCEDCGTELQEDDKQCPKCGSTKKAFRKEVSVMIGVDSSSKTTQKREGHRRPLREI